METKISSSGVGVILMTVAAVTGGAEVAAAQNPNEEPIAKVTRVDGVWSTDRAPAAALSTGSPIHRSDTIRVRDGYTPGRFLALLLPDGRRVQYTCPARGPCAEPFIPADSVATSLLDRGRTVIAAIWNQFQGSDSPAYASASSRGEAGDVSVVEAVLVLGADSLGLGPALSGGRETDLFVTLEPLDAIGEIGTRASVGPLRVRWLPDVSRARLGREEIRPGLFKLTIRASPEAEDGAEALVLITGSENEYERACATFERARTVTRDWDGAAYPEVRAFLQAALVYLHEQAHSAPVDAR